MYSKVHLIIPYMNFKGNNSFTFYYSLCVGKYFQNIFDLKYCYKYFWHIDILLTKIFWDSTTIFLDSTKIFLDSTFLDRTKLFLYYPKIFLDSTRFLDDFCTIRKYFCTIRKYFLYYPKIFFVLSKNVLSRNIFCTIQKYFLYYAKNIFIKKYFENIFQLSPTTSALPINSASSMDTEQVSAKIYSL